MDVSVIEEVNNQSIVIVIRNMFTETDIANYERKLNNIETWFGGKAFNREIPRLQRWYHIENRYFCPEWKTIYRRWESNIYEDWLLELQTNINDKLNIMLEDVYKKYPKMNRLDFNSVLINKYRDGNDNIKGHRDDERIFGDNPSIVSLSFGSERDFIMERVQYTEDDPLSMKLDKCHDLNKCIRLEKGTILIMAGSCQKYYIHKIPKDEGSIETRYNLTFRKI
jgi:alkylated DNA repair dioxygenase AlkB